MNCIAMIVAFNGVAHSALHSSDFLLGNTKFNGGGANFKITDFLRS